MKSDKKKNPSKGQADRFLKVSGLSLKITGNYMKQKMKEFFNEAEENLPQRSQTHLKNARLMAETIGEMKGTIMKLGQMLSLNRELLPPEFAEALGTLQQDAPPMPFSIIRDQIETELESKIEDHFSEFHSKPFAAASIGQVHWARLNDGREVVVKVQYPGVEDDVESDLKNIKILLHTVKTFGTEYNFTHLMRELRERMIEELDYLNEAQNLITFREHFQGFPKIRIPEPIMAYTRQRVLTMEFLPGTPLSVFSQEEPSGTKRNQLGELLVRFYLKQLYQHGCLHADPNPGNFAVGENGELFVYDFGCVKKFPKAFIKNYKRVLGNYFSGNYEEIEPGLDRLGVKKIKEKTYPIEFYTYYAKTFMEPFLKEPYNFGEAQLQEKVLQLAKENMGDAMNFRPPRHILFHNRVLVGAYNNLRTLRAVGFWRSILNEYLFF